MAGQGPSRRELLQALSLASAAARFLDSPAGALLSRNSATRNPFIVRSFFQPANTRQLRCCLTYIAHDARCRGKTAAGRREAGVAEFIDFMVFSDETLQQQFRDGFQWLDHAAARRDFVRLSCRGTECSPRSGSPTKPRSSGDEKTGQDVLPAISANTRSWGFTPLASASNHWTILA